MEYLLYMEQFNMFLVESISTEQTNNKMCRNDIYELYYNLYIYENRINRKTLIHIHKSKKVIIVKQIINIVMMEHYG
jgi:hypothetical protein